MALHAKKNFSEGREAAASLLLNTTRMIDDHYGSMQTEDIQSDLKKSVRHDLKKSNGQTKGVPTVKDLTTVVETPPEPQIIDIIGKLGGLDRAVLLPEPTLNLLLSDYSSTTADKVRLALLPMKQSNLPQG